MLSMAVAKASTLEEVCHCAMFKRCKIVCRPTVTPDPTTAAADADADDGDAADADDAEDADEEGEDDEEADSGDFLSLEEV